MKKIVALFALIALLIALPVLTTGCSNNAEDGGKPSPEVGAAAESEEIEQKPEILKEAGNSGASGEREENPREKFYSPFTGESQQERSRRKVVMVSIENSRLARPQSGLDQASIVYEFLVEGGITRFLALYEKEIPGEVGPVRSLRPYLIETAREYNALLLHVGASPAGFGILAGGVVDHLDQIYKSGYYWRDSSRKAPHNLYTGADRIEPYLTELTGQEYQPRFPFQQISFIRPEDSRADQVEIRYWGGYTVIYRYDREKNEYLRYLYDLEQPHKDAGGKQLTARNIIIQYNDTEVVDKVGRLKMELTGRDQALVFRDGIVIEGYWEKEAGDWTEFYTQEGERISLNPGQTWIQVVPRSTGVKYEEPGGGNFEETE